ncbi:MAG TPA: hypothetical protein VMM12_00595 [Longimicrobiales bacterium]|nr:hypothetical protein [Longimicrobiales bacterium]
MRQTTLCAGAIAALLFAGPARGQQITSPYDFVETAQGIRAFVTYVLTDRGAIDIGPGSGLAGGLGYNIRVSGPFEIDGQATLFPTSRRVFDISPTDSDSLALDPKAGLVELGTADLALLLVDASLRFDLTGPRTWYRLQPYASAGVGGVFRVASDNAVEENLPTDVELRVRFRNGFTGHVGAGFEWHATRRLTVRADARDLFWKLHVPEGFFQPGRSIDDEQWVQTAHLSLGLVFRF